MNHKAGNTDRMKQEYNKAVLFEPTARRSRLARVDHKQTYQVLPGISVDTLIALHEQIPYGSC